MLAAQKLQQKQEAKEPGCEIRLGKDSHPGSAPLRKLVRDGAEMAHEIKNLKAKLELVNKQIAAQIEPYLQKAGTGTGHIIAGTDKCTVSKMDKIGICAPDKLEGLLGEAFTDLVRVRTTYAPTKALTDKAMSGDDSEAIALRDCLDVEKGKTRVSYKTV